jgi:hypothetical protein
LYGYQGFKLAAWLLFILRFLGLPGLLFYLKNEVFDAEQGNKPIQVEQSYSGYYV